MGKRRFIGVCLSGIVLLYTGCSNNSGEMPGMEKKNRIELYIPDAREVQLYSTATESENYMKDCFVIIFNGSGVYKSGEKIDVAKITRNGSATVLLPQLVNEAGLGDIVHVICNTGLTALPGGITVESDLDDRFKPEKDYYFSGESLPMSGHNTVGSSSMVVTLTRAVAKVQIELDGDFNIGGEGSVPWWNDYMKNFDESRCGFIVGNYAGRSRIIPPLSGLSGNVSGRTAFYGTTAENRFIRFVQHAGSADSMTVYVSEYQNSIADCEGNTLPEDQFDDRRQFLLMIDRVSQGNSLLGDGMNANAWRLDFYDAATKKYLDIRRNYHYRFIVKKIRSAPYAYPLPSGPSGIEDAFLGDQEVWHNPGSNIEYKVAVKEDWANSNYSNGQYALSIDRDTITDATHPFRLKVQAPTGVDHSRIKTHILNIYDRNGVPVGSSGSDLEVNGYPNASAGIVFPTDGTETSFTFKINDDQYLDSAYMIIQLGNIYKKVLITLIDDWIYMPDPGFREYCSQKGFLGKIRAVDNRYVLLSPRGAAADTITMQRTTVVYGVNCGGVKVSIVSDVDISLYSAVSDLTGLEAFTNLEYLYVAGNSMTTIDVSANTKLKVLSAYNSPVASIKFGSNRELFVIFLSFLFGNSMESLDISHCSPNMCTVAARTKVLILTQDQQDANITYAGLIGSRQIVPSPY
ncbi:MAG: hypothetical protein LBL07_06705 [Tannerella sp.]|jgi:hypothetical protein|nr:hypothetical protein [Tannerella sp.]